MNTPAKLRIAWLTLLLVALAVTPGVLRQPVLAQATAWTEPVLIFEGEGETRLPTLTADKYGQVHAFWVYRPPGDVDGLIYYTRLDQINAQPVDILLAEAQGLISTAGAGGLAVFWNGSQYSLAGPSPQVSARPWDAPQKLASSYFNGGVATGPDDALWVLYGSNTSNAVFVQRLDPQLFYWDDPQLVANVSNPSSAPDALRLAIGPDRSLHAVWTEYQLPTGWPPRGLYYARSADGGLSWSLPREIANGLYNQPNVLAAPNGHVYIAWTGAAGTGGKYIQESPDGGQTWLPIVAVLPPPRGGSEGAPNMELDSAGNLHIVVSNLGCVWHLSREASTDTWFAPECISTQSAWIENPAMTLGLGNQIHVVYWTDARQLWYTTRTLDAPAIDPLPLPTPAPPTPTVIVPTAVPLPTATPLPDFGPLPEPGQASQAGVWALAAGAAPAGLLLLAVLIQRLGRRR